MYESERDQEQRLSNRSHMFIGRSGSNSSTVPEIFFKFKMFGYKVSNSVTLKLNKFSIFTHIMLKD